MEQFIGCDAHKKFSLFVAMNEDGEYGRAIRVGHDREVFRAFLEDLPPGSQIALETSGSYYWLVDEMERAGHRPQLAHALTAKRRMEGRHKTDERDARGLAMLLRNGTLPQVWIPPAELRDQREMLRCTGIREERNSFHDRESCRGGAARACWSSCRWWIRSNPRSLIARSSWRRCYIRTRSEIC